MGTGNIGTLSFDEAAAQAKYLTLKGETQTMRYLLNHNMIDQSMNDSLALREFFLTVYEKVTTKENPQNYLLNFVEEEKWHNKDLQVVIKEFIELTTDSNLRDEFIATLNCKQASNVIKNVCYDYTLDNIDLNSSMVFADTDNIVDYEFYLNNHFNAFGSTHYEDFGLLFS